MLSHQLGDRSMDPPTRSLPSYHFTLEATGGNVTFQATAEQAQDMLTQLQDLVKAADRITTTTTSH